MDLGGRSWRHSALGLVVGAVALAFASSAAAVPFTWTGLGSTPGFLNPGNWNSASPLSTATSLTFGALSAPCNASMPAGTCYQAVNDATNLSVNAIAFDDSQRYNVAGNTIALGVGGFTALDSGGPFIAGWRVPLTLTTSQTWSVTGQLNMGVPVSGAASALTVNFKPAPAGAATQWLLYGGDSEIGSVQLNHGQLQLGAVGQGTQLNASDGHPVDLSSGQLFMDGPAAVGPLTSVHSRVDLSTQALTVDGRATLDPHTTTGILVSGPASGQFGMLVATGGITLAGKLDLEQIGAGGAGSACSPLAVGKVLTIAFTQIPLTGTFANARPGATLPTFGGCPRGQGTTTLAKIGYTAHTVTATILAAPSRSAVNTALAGTVRLSRKQAKIAYLIKHGGYTTSWPAYAGLLSVTVTAKVKGKPVLVAVVNTSIDGAQRATVRVKLTKAGGRLLKRVHKLKVSSSGVFEPAWDPFVTPRVHKTFTLKR